MGSCRVSESCVYNVPNFISALIVSVATQQTIGELPPLRQCICILRSACLPAGCSTLQGLRRWKI